MSFHEGSNYQASREDQGKKMYEFEKKPKKEKQTAKELNAQLFLKMRPNLFILRSSKGMSQKELSKVLGFDPTRIEQIESRTGTPNLKEIMIIAEYFEVAMDDLLNKTYKIIFE